MAKFIFRRRRNLPEVSPAELPANAVGVPVVVRDDEDGVFNVSANPHLWRGTKQRANYAGEVAKHYRDIFTPARPKQTMAEFTGRADIVENIVQSIEEEQAHVLLCGHRRLGKSSLLNVVAEGARQAGFLIARISCTADLTFDAFLRAIFEDLSTNVTEAPAGTVLNKQLGVEQISDLIGPDELDVQSAVRAFTFISSQKVLVLVDDFHRIRDTIVRRQLCDLLAALTGNGAPVSLVIAAQNDTHDPFLLDHENDPAGVVTINLDTMPVDEISDMLMSGGQRLGIRFCEEVLQSMILLCQGIPGIAQWIGLLTVRRALRRYDDTVTMDDVVAAAQDTAIKADRNACMLLDRVLTSRDAARMDDILYLAARTSKPRGAGFSPSEINQEAARAGAPPHSARALHRLLTRYCEGEGAIFERTSTPDGPRYQFADPVTQSIVLLRNAIRQQASGTEALAAYLQHQEQILPGPESDPSDEFLRWLRFVLTPEDADLFDRWTRQDHERHQEIKKLYRHAQDDDDLETLLQKIQDAIAVVKEQSQPAMDVA